MSLTSPAWHPAVGFTDPAGQLVRRLLDRPRQDWGAAPHAAAALAWKAYSWWTVRPVVLALAAGDPVPRLDLAGTEVQLLEDRPFIRVRAATPAVLEGYDVLGAVRATLLHDHLEAVATALSRATRVGVRTLRGSVAEAVSYQLRDVGRAELADHLLHVWGLTDLLGDVGPQNHRTRRTCCLALTVPGLGICATCPAATRLRSPAAVG